MLKPWNFLLVIAVFWGVSGCAGLSASEQMDRDYRKLEYSEQFKAERRRCFARGGRMIVDALGQPGRDGVPKHGARYLCAT